MNLHLTPYNANCVWTGPKNIDDTTHTNDRWFFNIKEMSK